jgi:hypothetical protein
MSCEYVCCNEQEKWSDGGECAPALRPSRAQQHALAAGGFGLVSASFPCSTTMPARGRYAAAPCAAPPGCGAPLCCSISSAKGANGSAAQPVDSRRWHKVATRTSCNRQERLLHPPVQLGRRAKQRCADGRSIRVRLLSWHLSAALHVNLVACQHQRNVLACDARRA